jgi:hypothetical protein
MMMINKLDKPFEIGDLVHLTTFHPPEIAIIVKVKKLLRLYDILLQKEQIYLKDVHEQYINKI